jgi:hypothetical protein
MTPDQDWSTASPRAADETVGALGSLRIALLFGAAAIAFALVAAPLADRSTDALLAGSGLDRMSTGSVQPAGDAGNYTIRRSVLQANPNSVCIIRANGTRSGDC